MKKPKPNTSRLRLLLEFLIIISIGFILKVTLDAVIWRYSGPVSLVIMLGLIYFYLHRRGHSFFWIGLVPLKSVKSRCLILPQTLLAFIAIAASGLAIGLGGELLGLEFMKPDATGATDRFGDLAGNTYLYLTWIAILWIAGPAEELYFRGFMIGQLREILGRSRWATAFSIIIPAILFGAGHMYYQGLRGLFMTGGIAVSMGVLFILYKRNIWPLAIAHAAFNTFVFTALYMQWDI